MKTRLTKSCSKPGSSEENESSYMPNLAHNNTESHGDKILYESSESVLGISSVPVADTAQEQLAEKSLNSDKVQTCKVNDIPLTDLGNAVRFARDHGNTLRYVLEWRKWLAWNGSHWVVDTANIQVMQAAKSTARGIFIEASSTSDVAKQTSIAKHARESQSHSRLNAMVSLASSEEPFPTSQSSLDKDAWLLNTSSGTVDLCKGFLREHRKNDMLTKSTCNEYGGECHQWMAFLDTIFAGDQSMIDFIQRLMGCALIGEQREHLLPIFYGSGANGKSVFINAILSSLGDYAGSAAPGLFMTSKSERHATELADLYGMRIVVLAETRDGARLDEGLVKALTGGDQIKARRMREDFWQFKPSHMPIIVSNHRPVVRGTDHGIWRRIRLIPFSVTILPDEQETSLTDKLRDEAAGILKWLVEGCQKWQHDGLNEPDAIRLATDEYRGESDLLSRWIEECDVNLCDKSKSTKASHLIESYNAWAEKVHEPSQNPRWLSKQLEERGLTKLKDRQGVKYQGISLS